MTSKEKEDAKGSCHKLFASLIQVGVKEKRCMRVVGCGWDEVFTNQIVFTYQTQDLGSKSPNVFLKTGKKKSTYRYNDILLL